mmetsp:Transcript_10907/g.18656  ORF Transcript_10907/g.18656 Transcript_10907/m.18656 type:complete len:309 (-) Transcript_10907:286-1212(-)|eukprot:CAMPEP_0184695698 /NCGR_PEP_ID=MMETSP0313-20130426/3256_1 /TAXON_ID=2792 /ORGANISM="Porphyridium aerugineum, Strain SAG 1380-2" /LENGTH=308 /DNA_ID=CAMNT_0027154211 /DNA_START=90 /DNA_END=1016 /DNA_ORIENTATION=+
MDAALGLLGLGAPCNIQLDFLDPLHASDRRKFVSIGKPGQKQEILPLFGVSETVSGKIVITPKDNKALQHLGIRVEFVGSIEMLYDHENSQEFTSLVRELDGPGTISGPMTYNFSFANVVKQYDTYRGINVRLRYFVRVSLLRAQYSPSMVKEFDIAVRHKQSLPEQNPPIHMEVGIEDALHIEFEYNKSKYELRDVVIGKIYFLLVRIKIKRMELEIRKRESAGSGSSVFNDTDTIAKYEIMDGTPVRGETIPMRLFLGAYPILTPSYRAVNNKFSVKYYLNLVIVDEDDRRYYKQSEIYLWDGSAS